MNNVVMNSIETDYELSTILGNFSEDYISIFVSKALDCKFRPFGSRMPNFPQQIYSQFQGIMDHSGGYDKEISAKRDDIFSQIINIICNYYDLSVNTDTIPEDQLYPMANILYQLFVSEFCDRMINLFSGYIINNLDSLVNAIPENDRIVKTQYSKKVYTNPNFMIGYDNISKILDLVEGLDIDMHSLITMISDIATADFVCSYIQDAGDIYKNHYVYYLLDQNTKTDTFAEIKLRFVSATTEANSMINDIIKIQ